MAQRSWCQRFVCIKVPTELSSGVPTELSSDGGPKFIGQKTKEFPNNWRLTHRMCFAYLPTSNSRAELAVKLTKRLLMEKVDASGDLNIDSMFQALLTQQNTSDSGSRLSATQILFSGPLKDT